MRYKITDTAGTSGTVECDARDIAETITSWYPDAPAEVLDAIQGLEDAVRRGDPLDGPAAYLGVTVTRQDPQVGAR